MKLNHISQYRQISAVRGSKHNAVLYSQVNDLQQQFGKKLAFTAEIKHGDNVLDMGCGTGEITAFLAEMVGKQTQVAGVDPDIERIYQSRRATAVW